MHILTPISPMLYAGLWTPVQKRYVANIFVSDNNKANLIAEIVCDYYKVSIDDAKGQGRKRELVNARQVAMYFAKKKTRLSLKDIGGIFGGRDHSTVIYGIQTVEDIIDTDRDFKKRINELETLLNRLPNQLTKP